VNTTPAKPRKTLIARLSPFGTGQRDDARAGKARLEAFLDAVPGEYCGFAEDGTVAYSDGFANLLGVASIRSLQDIQSALLPGDAAALETLYPTLHEQGHGFSIVVRSAASYRVMRLTGRQGKDLSGTVRFNIIWVEDTTVSQNRIDALESNQDQAINDRDRLQAALDLMPEPLWMRDRHGDLTWCNRAYARMVDATQATVVAEQKELPAKPVKRGGAMPRPVGRALALEAIHTNAPAQGFAHVIAAGRRMLLQVTERPWSDPLMTLGSVTDLTREEELETEHKRYRIANNELLGQLGTAISIYDSEQKLEFFNTSFAQLWGLEDSWLNTRPRLGDIMEKLRSDRRLPEQADFRRFKQSWLDMFTSLIGQHEDMLYLPNDKALRMLVVPHPMGGLMMTFEDVSSRLQLESSYNTLVAVQKETLDHLSEGVAVFGGDGRIKLWNPAFTSLWKLNPEDLDGEPHISRLVEKMRPLFKAEDWPHARIVLMSHGLDRATASGRLEGINGILIGYSTVPLPDGGVLVTHIDVTDAARVENALREKNAALEAAERLKLDFLANVSYQLRTPLSTIVGFSEILAHEYFGTLNERQKEYTAGMRDAGERLVSLIDDILDLSTIEAGYMQLSKAAVPVEDLFASLNDLTGDWARKQQIEVVIDCAPDTGAVLADERRLKQVLLNLIRNGIAYSPAGGHITLKGLRQNDNIILTVSDTGLGIAPEDKDRIFEPFERVGYAQQEGSHRGAGLGLTLVRNIIQLHGGTVRLDSTLGQGTDVVLTLPAAGQNDAVQPKKRTRKIKAE
jgi:signal transduction histidine kinase